MRRCCVALTLWLAVTPYAANVVSAQDYPSKAIRIVTNEPGSSSEVVARTFALGIAGPLGQPVVIESRAGGGVIVGEIVAKSPPDGHTLLSVGSSFWLGPLFRKSPFDPIKDFAPITISISVPNVLVIHPSLPVKSVKELVALAKAKPGALNYSSGSTGSSPHLSMELFKHMTGTNIVQIPYKGAGSSTMALVSGQVEMSFASSTSVAAYIKSGRLKALAVTSLQPSALAPGVPTIAASVPGYESVSVSGMFAPAKTPAAVINRLNREMVRVLNQPDVKERFLNLGTETVGSTPDQLGSTVASEMTKWGKVIQQAGIKLE